MANQSSAELEKWSPSAEALELAEKVILGEAELPAQDDPAVVSRSIMERILESTTFEETFSARELEAWRDYEGVPVTINSWHLNPSSVEGDEGGSGVYAVVDLTRMDDGEHIAVTCGGANVLAQLVTATRNGWLDRPVKLTSNKTRAGYSALWLEAA
jgi:hypothetical protein